MSKRDKSSSSVNVMENGSLNLVIPAHDHIPHGTGCTSIEEARVCAQALLYPFCPFCSQVRAEERFCGVTEVSRGMAARKAGR